MSAIAFDNSYARLPDRFFARLDPSPVATPKLIAFNDVLAAELGLSAELLSVDVLAGNAVPDGAEPLAMAYAGHQFGNWVPQLGDGRALLLGEVVSRGGARFDVQLKGAGRTPFSRGGDGRAWLGPVLREYVMSEAMAALGVPTTRALAAVETGEAVLREEMLPGAVLTRVSRAHIRVGTFQFFAARDDADGVKALADHAIARLSPELGDADEPYLAFLKHVVGLQAELVAKWMAFGFIHGVMNTDNMSVAGETIDYGPCAFLDAYHPAKVFSSIDQMGRYAYQNQPGIAQWNLANLAQSLLPLVDADREVSVEKAQAAIDGFVPIYQEAWRAVMAAKLGLGAMSEADDKLAQALLKAMAENQVDFTLLFRALAEDEMDAARGLFVDPTVFDGWAEEWRARLAEGGLSDAERGGMMCAASPAIIPRNHRIEAAIAAAVGGDYGPFERLVAALTRPFEDIEEYSDLRAAPAEEELVEATFCGT